MEEIYGGGQVHLHSSSGGGDSYGDKALMSPDDDMMMMIPAEYSSYHHNLIPSSSITTTTTTTTHNHHHHYHHHNHDHGGYFNPLLLGDSPDDHHHIINSSHNQMFHHQCSAAAAAAASESAASITREVDVQRGGGRRHLISSRRDSSNNDEEGIDDEDNDDADEGFTLIKAKIASHPSYPKLLNAFIDCQKVGAPPEIASLLDEIRAENNFCKRRAVTTCYGADPELDEFMETYCDVLIKYKSDLSRPFHEATTFLNNIETQLGNLCKDEGGGGGGCGGGGSSDEEFSGGETTTEVQDLQMKSEDRELKDRLLQKYGSHITNLKLEFSKKKKKGKLPKEARQTLLQWWNLHIKWPYPTEADKMSLAEVTGLDQKQINNWFINQRKRHWKPSENMQLAFINNFSGQFFTDD